MKHGIVHMLGDSDELLSRAADAIALFRRHSGHGGYARVGFEDADYDAIPASTP